MYNDRILLGRFSQKALDHILNESSQIMDTGKRIDFISGQFLGIGYGESTLTGDKDTPEVFVINLHTVDCFTLLDYVEAMRISSSYSGFEENLKKVRYKSGVVSFQNRNHFFTDWKETNAELIEDITGKIGADRAIKVQKFLNRKEDGTHFIDGIEPFFREMTCIPSSSIDDSVLEKMRTGDYVGIYSHMKGLDVSHLGIIIKDVDTIYLRHASSQKEFRKVIDQDFKSYMADNPGIVVFRCKD